MSKSSKKPSNLIEKTPGSQSRFQVVKASCEQSVFLTDWWLTEVQSNSEGRRLGVAGFPSRGRQTIREFKSSAIIKRHDAVTLETEDGITVTITNGLNMFRSLENGFAQEVCNHFLCGFPYYWKEFGDKSVGQESTNKTGPFKTFSVNGVATFLDDLPVAHVRDIIMLSSGDSARCLIENCISIHIRNRQEDNAAMDDVNCAKNDGKRKRQEDDTNDSSRLVASDLSDDVTLKTQGASATEEKKKDKSGALCSTDPEKATTRKEDDTDDNSQLLSGESSVDATSKTRGASKIEEKSEDKGGALCSTDPKNATTRKEDETNDNSRLMGADFSDDGTQNASKIEEKSKNKGDALCSTDPKKATKRKEDETNDNGRSVSGDLSVDATPKTQNASKVEEKRNDKGDTVCPTDTLKENTPQVKSNRITSIDKNSSRRVTRSMSKSNIKGRRERQI